jgi:hypothetical protein
MATPYRQTGTLVLPVFFAAGVIAYPFYGFMGPWAVLVGLPVMAVFLLLVDRAIKPELYDLRGLVGMILVGEVGGIVALLVTVAKAQVEDVGWWLPVVEAVALVALLRVGLRAWRRHRRQGKELAFHDLTLREAREVMTLGKLAVEHAGTLLAGQPGFDRAAAVRDLRRRMRRRPVLGPAVAGAISERETVWGWVPPDDPLTLDLAADLVTEAAATPAA